VLEKYEKKGRPRALLRSPLHITVYQLLLKLQTDLHAVVAAKGARFGVGASRQGATGKSKSTTGWRNTGEKLLKDLLRKRA